jgi:hypothetical protein
MRAKRRASESQNPELANNNNGFVSESTSSKSPARKKVREAGSSNTEHGFDHGSIMRANTTRRELATQTIREGKLETSDAETAWLSSRALLICTDKAHKVRIETIVKTLKPAIDGASEGE